MLAACVGAFLLLGRYVVAMLPVVAFGRITEGSLTAELGIRYAGEDDQVTVIVMNMLVRSVEIHHRVLQRNLRCLCANWLHCIVGCGGCHADVSCPVLSRD
jgi:hypothetical protein